MQCLLVVDDFLFLVEFYVKEIHQYQDDEDIREWCYYINETWFLDSDDDGFMFVYFLD